MARVADDLTDAGAFMILVVEDEPFLRELTALYLEECGFSVLQAANADQAIELLRKHDQVGAVFSDIQMPGSVNGIGLAQWIAKILPEVKVLLTSGQILPAAAREWTLLAKPYEMSDVARRLRAMIAQG